MAARLNPGVWKSVEWEGERDQVWGGREGVWGGRVGAEEKAEESPLPPCSHSSLLPSSPLTPPPPPPPPPLTSLQLSGVQEVRLDPKGPLVKHLVQQAPLDVPL
jgi:hypothetical protein